jgi:hypothetical protein
LMCIQLDTTSANWLPHHNARPSYEPTTHERRCDVVVHQSKLMY